MIELSGVHRDKNFQYAGHATRPNSPPEISLTGDTELINSNLTLARITKNGYQLTRTGCNERGLRLRINPGDVFVKQDSFTLPVKEALPQAVQIRETIIQSARDDVLEAWNFAVSTLIANPTMTEAQWLAEQTAWATKTGAHSGRPGKINLIEPSAALARIIASFWPGKSFIDVRNDIVAHSSDAWSGKPTQLIVEWD